MKRARVMVHGIVHNATERDGQVVLEDGRIVAANEGELLARAQEAAGRLARRAGIKP